jgi:serine protease
MRAASIIEMNFRERLMRPIYLLTGLLVMAMAQGNAVAPPEYNPVRHHPAGEPETGVQRVIVKLRAPTDSARMQAQLSTDAVVALAGRMKLTLLDSRHIASGMHVLHVQPQISGDTLAQTLANLRADPAVEYAEPDHRRYAHATPNDPLFSEEWYMQNTQASAVDAVSAWDLTTGSAGVVIAELDTGVRFDHPDLRSGTANRLLPGYDMIGPDPDGSFTTANDGNGRDSDASDPGDWVTTSDLQKAQFSQCTQENSSWHGTRVAGILGAITNNSTGIAGLTWSNWILPVRVLGKCGGYDSDILAGMLWAAGSHVDGVPDNPYPAKIINMSLGSNGGGSCPMSYQQTVNQLVSLGVLVVVSAGNEGGPVDAPANCNGVAGIAGLRQVGTKVGFSSLGPEIALSAPAGNCVNTGAGQPCLFSIDTTTNSGTTSPATNIYTDQLNFNVGTSFSAPIVAGIAGLMASVNGNLSSEQLIARLQEGAQPFPVSSDPSVPQCHVPASSSDLQTAECSCTTQACGAGMANAKGAVLAALRPIAAVAIPAGVSAGLDVTLNGSGSAAACNHTVAGYAWTVVSPTTNPPPIQNANTASATVVAPSGSATYTLRLTVTDDAGRQDTADVAVAATGATSSAPSNAGNKACPAAVSIMGPSSSPSSSGGGGGGGGAIDLLTLVVCAVAIGSVRLDRRVHVRSH